jgi:hypothetical protein
MRSRPKRRCDHDAERGAALIIAIAFMMMIGVVSAGLLAFITTSVNARPRLDAVRNRQYAADAAIEYSIARVRGVGANGPALTSCAGPDTQTSNSVTIRVECTDVPISVNGFLQRNVVFVACLSSAANCTNEAIIRAQVNYEATFSSPIVVTKTYIQSWSVNR